VLTSVIATFTAVRHSSYIEPAESNMNPLSNISQNFLPACPHANPPVRLPARAIRLTECINKMFRRSVDLAVEM
jgi:hypothetical protein